ncbi:DSBA oxidoreductase [Comamonadaceae bacterium]|nr:DSBA oxidoreductase [Comamonadaceae bacterium]
MSATLSIDFVSDVSCPWCAIGLSALEQALARVAPEITAKVQVQPFELNPNMPAGGQDITEHLTQKYGSTAQQQSAIRETIRQRGAELGFTFRVQGRDRIYNTFDAHRLMHWAELAGLPGQQLALKKALLQAYFSHGQSPEDRAVLVQAAASVGLDSNGALGVLSGDAYALDVRERERLFTQAGIQSVPAVIINQQHLISGGQPVAVFERALRQIAAGA